MDSYRKGSHVLLNELNCKSRSFYEERESYTSSILGSDVCNSDLGNTMTDFLILPCPGYSEASLLGSFRTSNDALDSFKQQRLRYTKNLIISFLNINSLRNKFLKILF